jgi:hypothetical protein
MQKKHVKELAESFSDTGGEPGNMPWIRNGTREVVAGRDRIAAAMTLKLTHLWVRTGDYTDAEAKKAELSENLRRRQDNREKMLSQASKLEAAEIAAKEAEEKAKDPGTPVPPKRERKTAKGKARESVAAKAGVKAESVRKAEQRQKAKAKAAEPKPEGEPPCIDSLGLTVAKGLNTARWSCA